MSACVLRHLHLRLGHVDSFVEVSGKGFCNLTLREDSRDFPVPQTPYLWGGNDL